ncbi:MAG: MFS transporter [Microbacterium sp.]|uniref:MFS transporter n=1 Tax=Microbacterium sp. TaxID=51671 RepID=UPI002725D4BD|nr:MFS transporter [Microbacterium sp.]MDO8382844.1 MFS transporter [Microbacterium sp.]
MSARTPLAADAGRPGRILTVTTLGIVLVTLNSSAILVALPDLSLHFDVEAGAADWFVLANMAALTASVMIFGRLSDMLGRRRIYLWGLGAFVLTCALCIVAPNAIVFTAMRAAQGVAAAMVLANSQALVADAVSPPKLAAALGTNIAAASAAITLGPTFGGLLVDLFGWPAIFLINLPFGLVALALGFRFVPPDRARRARPRFDVGGAVLSTLGIVALLFGINRLSFAVDEPLPAIAGITLGVFLLTAFVLLERVVASPLVDPVVVWRRERGTALGATVANSFTRGGVGVLLMLHSQVADGATAMQAGLSVLPIGLCITIGTPIGARLSSAYSTRAAATLGATLVACGAIALIVALPTDWLTRLPFVILVGLGIGIFTTPNAAAVLEGVGIERRSVATSVRSMLFNSGQLFGTSVALLIVTLGGVSTYAAGDVDPAGFQWGMAAVAGAATVAAILAACGVGPWRRASAADSTPHLTAE